jgi:DnaJ-class molecular chaperone
LKVYDESEYSSCPFCSGDEVDDAMETSNDSFEQPWTGSCADCDGTGRVECNVCEGESEVNGEVCPACNGDGDMACPDCDGTGEATYHMGEKIK